MIDEPELVVHTLSEEDRIIFLASDGIWEFVTSEEIIKLAGEYYERNEIEKACN